MRQRTGSRTGFTLIELMMVVAILGIIAAIAIPTFTLLVSRSKTAEASSNINSMFKSASSYYSGEKSSQSMQATTTGECTVGPAGPEPAAPGNNKQKFDSAADPNFQAIHFTIADLVYYSYSIDTPEAFGKCGWAVGTSAIYTFSAEGDLDGDFTLSRFELAAGSDASNTLYHARGIHILREAE